MRQDIKTITAVTPDNLRVEMCPLHNVLEMKWSNSRINDPREVSLETHIKIFDLGTPIKEPSREEIDPARPPDDREQLRARYDAFNPNTLLNFLPIAQQNLNRSKINYHLAEVHVGVIHFAGRERSGYIQRFKTKSKQFSSGLLSEVVPHQPGDESSSTSVLRIWWFLQSATWQWPNVFKREQKKNRYKLSTLGVFIGSSQPTILQ